MTRLLFSLLLTTTLIACAGENFDDATIPAGQLKAEMAFKRMAVHGSLEPVLDVGNEINKWQFFVASGSKVSILGSEPVRALTLKDRSGIAYSVNAATTPSQVFDRLEPGTYGYATGKVTSVIRDLVAGEIEVEMVITEWSVRKIG